MSEISDLFLPIDISLLLLISETLLPPNDNNLL